MFRRFISHIIYRKYNTEYLNLIENGHKIFEGIYKNGIKWNGKGKEYNKNIKLTFEGEYKNGIKIGKITEYYDNGNLKFVRECKYGIKIEEVKE